MTRIILISGKGGVGKTTVAAATALSISRRKRRTLVLSFDLAHSLRDSFGPGLSLDGAADKGAQSLDDWLDLRELDVSREIEREWGAIYSHLSLLMSRGGLNAALSQELAMLPGMEDIAALLALDTHVKSKAYDTIVMDCPPTASTLRFVGMSAGLRWYADNRLKRERALANVLRPFARMLDRNSFYLPGDQFFATFAGIVARLDALEAVLQDPAVTSLRLVTNPEQMVLRETQRAFMYFAMYGIAVDQIVINRIFLDDEPYFENFATAQRELIETIEENFEGVPCARVPFMAAEVVGRDALSHLAGFVYGDRDPGTVQHRRMPVNFRMADREAFLEMSLPFAEKGEIDVSRQDDVVLLRIGTYKRRIALPAAVMPHPRNDATLKDGKLVVRFWGG